MPACLAGIARRRRSGDPRGRWAAVRRQVAGRRGRGPPGQRHHRHVPPMACAFRSRARRRADARPGARRAGREDARPPAGDRAGDGRVCHRGRARSGAAPSVAGSGRRGEGVACDRPDGDVARPGAEAGARAAKRWSTSGTGTRKMQTWARSPRRWSEDEMRDDPRVRDPLPGRVRGGRAARARPARSRVRRNRAVSVPGRGRRAAGQTWTRARCPV